MINIERFPTLTLEERTQIAQQLDAQEVGETGRVLVMMEAARQQGITGLDESRVHAYTLLLAALEISPTLYSFKDCVLPWSTDLDDDIVRLVGGGYVSSKSTLSLTVEGQKIVKELLDCPEKVTKGIGKIVSGWHQLNVAELREVINNTRYQGY